MNYKLDLTNSVYTFTKNEVEVTYNNISNMEESMVVYALFFPNSKYYVGQTRNKLKSRISSHLSESLKMESYKNNAIKKYKKITVIILDKCKSVEELSLSEKYWIKKLESNVKGKGYNVTEGGDSNWSHTPFTRKLMSKAHTGLHHSEETKNKIKESMIGKFNKKVFVTGINKIFLSITECAQYFNCSVANVSTKIKMGLPIKENYLAIKL